MPEGRECLRDGLQVVALVVLLLGLRTIYVDQYYNQRIDFQPTTQNYQSARLGRRESGLKSVENSKVDRTTLIPPGEIKNGFLLKGKNSS